jgi:asparagine synthase (glutamine-hydrolysing)
VLGGDGGDEGFAGYRKHRMVSVRERAGNRPALRALAARLLARLPPSADRTTGWSTLLRRVARLGRSIGGTDAQAYRALTQVEPLDRTARYAAAPGGEDMQASLEAQFDRSRGSQLQRTLATDTLNTLPNDLLTKVDRASMHFSLEVRVPFLDHHVFETGLGLPDAFTLGRKGKEVLRSLAAREVGPAVANRPKHGFEVPVETWLRGPLRALGDEVFSREAIARHGVLSAETLADGRWHRAAEQDALIVWNALALAVWCQRLETTSSVVEPAASENFSWSS